MAGDRITLDAATVERMVTRQFPQWSHLEVRPVVESGWDNLTFHLGAEMKIRLPSAVRYAAQVEKENRFLPMLAPHLPLAVPVPLGIGQPDEDFAWPWAVYGWIAGETSSADRVADMAQFARDLAGFLLALQRIDTTDGPPAGEQNFHRGGDLSVYDGETRACIALLGEKIDGKAALGVWEMALASRWDSAPVWMHGDVAVGNLLVRDGRLTAVIDFGGCGIGDPACDLVISWLLFDAEARAAFRQSLPYDKATWQRARGWALWKALLMASRGQNVHPAERPPLDVVQLVIGETRAEG